MKKILLSAALLAFMATPAFAKECNKKQGETSTVAEKGERKGKRGKRGAKRGNPMKKLDTNEDGKLSKEEAKGPILENFDKIDTDSDGFLTEEELKAAHKARHGERKEKRKEKREEKE